MQSNPHAAAMAKFNNSSIAPSSTTHSTEAPMFQNREEFSNARQHLHLLQTKVEQALTLLVLQFNLWNDDGDNESSTAEIVQLSLEFKALIEDHFQQVSGDGLLERAVTQHPSLSPVLRDVEKWQAAILNDLSELIEEIKANPISKQNIAQYRNTMRRLQNEILAEEKQERHLMERGWA